MLIPWQALSEEALQGLVEEFVTRDGSDYGVIETSLATRVEQVKRALQRGELVVVYSEAHEQANIMPAEQLR